MTERGNHVGDYFDQLVKALRKEPNILLPDVDSLIQSHVSGYAGIITDQDRGEIIGFARITPLVPDDLCLGTQVYEMGTAWVDPEKRRGGIMKDIIGELLDRARGSLTIATTKIDVGRTDNGFSTGWKGQCNEKGLNPVMIDPREWPFIAALTCVCDGDFGQGCQHGLEACTFRPSAGHNNEEEKICYLLVSDEDLAKKTNDAIGERFENNVNDFINYLSQQQYYA